MNLKLRDDLQNQGKDPKGEAGVSQRTDFQNQGKDPKGGAGVSQRDDFQNQGKDPHSKRSIGRVAADIGPLRGLL